MTVKELIERLQTLPQDQEACIDVMGGLAANAPPVTSASCGIDWQAGKEQL